MRLYGAQDTAFQGDIGNSPHSFKGSEYSITHTKKGCCRGFFSSSYYHAENLREKLHLHVPTNAWSKFTGCLREHLLPWRWMVAYLDRANGEVPQRILVCNKVEGGKLPQAIRDVLGKSLLQLELENRKMLVRNSKGTECLVVNDDKGEGNNVYIFRANSVFGCLIYLFGKYLCKSQTKEITLTVGYATEKVLVERQKYEKVKAFFPGSV